MFPYNWESIVAGRATQTARLVKLGQFFEPADTYTENSETIYLPESVWRWGKNGLTATGIYQVGKTYAVQPGRGKASIARIRISSIERRDVREYTDEDVRREGFDSKFRFMDVWCCMHDKDAARAAGIYFARRGEPVFDAGDALSIYKLMYEGRPAERYNAWIIRFCLAEGV